MSEQTDLVDKNYLNELYKDLYIKSAVDVDATIDIISCIEDLSRGGNIINEKGVCSETSLLPGKAPMELVREFKKFGAISTKGLILDNILELRNSLYRFQSLECNLS